MSKYAQREATERALVHHGVAFHRDEGRWVIDGTVMTDAQAYAYALGFKKARDRWDVSRSVKRLLPPERERCQNHAVAENFCNECGR